MAMAIHLKLWRIWVFLTIYSIFFEVQDIAAEISNIKVENIDPSTLKVTWNDYLKRNSSTGYVLRYQMCDTEDYNYKIYRTSPAVLKNVQPNTCYSFAVKLTKQCTDCETWTNDINFLTISEPWKETVKPTGQPEAKDSPGLQGPAGIPGRDGYPGLPGLKGMPGSPGFSGLPGMPGLQGPPGKEYSKEDVTEICAAVLKSQLLELTGKLQGPPGRPGENGIDGPPGLTGQKGESGLPGLPGSEGLDGLPGLKGEPGEKGERGPEGVGPKGLPGIHGRSSGVSGLRIYRER